MNTQTNRSTDFIRLKTLLTSQANSNESPLALDKFRQRYSDSPSATTRTFAVRKRIAKIYLSTFYLISGLLFTLSLYVFAGSPNWLFTASVAHSWLIKLLVGSFGLCISAAAATVGYHVTPELEVSIHLVGRAKRRLRQSYWVKATAIGRQANREGNDTTARLKHLRATYQDSKAQLDDRKDENSVLIRQISRADSLSSETKEKLINQALHQLEHKLQGLLNVFRELHD